MKLFFFDNNLSEKLTSGMKAFGENVVHLKEIFPEDASDPEWLRYIGEQGLILITRDNEIRHHPAEIGALRRYKVGAFFLSGKNLNRCKLVQQVTRNWPRIKEYAEKEDPPYAFRIPGKGTKFVRIL
jgi:predicted nuclease of predicted toxin-antitoxin system